MTYTEKRSGKNTKKKERKMAGERIVQKMHQPTTQERKQLKTRQWRKHSSKKRRRKFFAFGFVVVWQVRFF